MNTIPPEYLNILNGIHIDKITAVCIYLTHIRVTYNDNGIKARRMVKTPYNLNKIARRPELKKVTRIYDTFA